MTVDKTHMARAGWLVLQYVFSHPVGQAAVIAVLVLAGCNKPAETPTAAIGSRDASPAATTSAAPLRSTKPPADPNYPRVVMQTNLGNITVQLDGAKAPVTVQNFLNYVAEGFYDQTVFHQVATGKVVLGGAYTVDMKEKKPHTPIRNEAHNGLKNTRGTIGMARQSESVDSATSQFFFNLGDNSWLDYRDRTLEAYGYCVFGQVVEGLDVLDRMAAVEVRSTEQSEQMPVQKIVLQSARRVR